MRRCYRNVPRRLVQLLSLLALLAGYSPPASADHPRGAARCRAIGVRSAESSQRVLRLPRLPGRLGNPGRHFRASACTGVTRDLRSAGGASVAATRDRWIPLFDGRSLQGWESANFGGEGEVRVEEGRIVMDFGEMLTGITYQESFPSSDYEIRVQAKRTAGIDFFCGLTFPVGESHCSFIAAGWAGAVVGLSCIDGKDASENETTKYMNFENDRWYRFRVRVTDQRIQAWIDERPVIDQTIANRKLSVRPEVELSKPLGIAAWQSRAELRGLEYRRLD